MKAFFRYFEKLLETYPDMPMPAQKAGYWLLFGRVQLDFEDGFWCLWY